VAFVTGGITSLNGLSRPWRLNIKQSAGRNSLNSAAMARRLRFRPSPNHRDAGVARLILRGKRQQQWFSEADGLIAKLPTGSLSGHEPEGKQIAGQVSDLIQGRKGAS
jgi:hypothetical protein